MSRDKNFEEDYYSFRILLASVVAGNEPLSVLAEKLRPYIYESEEEYQKLLDQETNKRMLADSLANCKGVRVKNFNFSKRSDYDAYVSIEFENAEAVTRHHSNVMDVIQQTMNRQKLSAKVFMSIDSIMVHPGVPVIENQFAVELT